MRERELPSWDGDGEQLAQPNESPCLPSRAGDGLLTLRASLHSEKDLLTARASPVALRVLSSPCRADAACEVNSLSTHVRESLCSVSFLRSRVLWRPDRSLALLIGLLASLALSYSSGGTEAPIPQAPSFRRGLTEDQSCRCARRGQRAHWPVATSGAGHCPCGPGLRSPGGGGQTEPPLLLQRTGSRGSAPSTHSEGPGHSRAFLWGRGLLGVPAILGGPGEETGLRHQRHGPRTLV